MTPDLFALLRRVDTPTVCNAIEMAQERRGFDAFTRGTVICTAPEAPPLVGYAVTAQIAAKAPPQRRCHNDPRPPHGLLQGDA